MGINVFKEPSYNFNLSVYHAHNLKILIPDTKGFHMVGLSQVCHENYSFKEVNDTNDFEVSKLGGTIEWE